jgi:hypothetical protein
MRRYSRTEINKFEEASRLLSQDRRSLIRDILQRAYRVMLATPESSRPHQFADGIAAATVQDCRRYPTERQAWWIGELHRQWCRPRQPDARTGG